MIRRLPILPSLLVLVAVAIMVRLGLWQLDRMHHKDAMLASYAVAGRLTAEVPWPRDAMAAEALLYRRSRIACPAPRDASAMAGQNRAGESGQAHIVHCPLPDGQPVLVVLGWSQDPAAHVWAGGNVTGIIAPGPRLVADPPLAGLAANAVPDPSTIPNNHLSYAVQWFVFASIAVVIYLLALRKRLAGQAARG